MSNQQSPEDVPVIPRPDGMPSNFDDPPSLHEWTLGVGITCMVVMTIAVSVRTYTKAAILRDMRHEDYVALFALVGFLVWGVIYLYLSSIGLTRDLWNIRAVDFPNMLYLVNVFQVIYPPAMGAAKYFICVQLKRLFCPHGSSAGSVWWALQTVIVATVGYYISCFFTFLFQCVPREKIWHPMIEGRCIDNTGGVLSAGLINLILDLALLAIPCWAIWHLQMPLKRRLGAISIFAVGIFTCVIAALGVAYRIPMLTAMNQTNAIAKVGLWTFAELAGTIVVGCMPMFPRFYEHLSTLQGPFSSLSSLKSFLSSRMRSSQSTSQFSRANNSTQRIVVTSEFERRDLSGDPGYIELRDGMHPHSKWGSTNAV